MNNRLNFSHLTDLSFTASQDNNEEMQLMPVANNNHSEANTHVAQKLSPYFFDDIIKKYSQQ